MRNSKNRFSGGFTLIELLVVVAITAILSVGVITNMINFQKDAKLDSFTKEFASALETARNRSVNGEVPAGGAFDAYTEEDTLPFWVVDVSSTKYSVYSKYKKKADPGFTSSNAEETLIPTGNVISPAIEMDFGRLTGKTTATPFTITISGYSRTETVTVDEFGNVKITK